MPPRHPNRGRRLRLETLEDRTALTAGPIGSTAPMTLTPQTPSLASIPNDPGYPDQWALKSSGQAVIGAPRAWDVTRGSTKVTVAVLDTGIDHIHPDLYLNVWINQAEIPAGIKANLVDTDGDGLTTFRDLNDVRNQGAGKITDVNKNGYIDGGDVIKPTSLGGWADGISNNGDRYIDDLVGWNFVTNTNDPFDDHGHGTHVSGTIGAIGNNGLGVAGVAWTSQVMGLKIFDSRAAGDTGWAVAAMDYATAMGAKVVNESWVLGSSSTTLAAAIDRAKQAGVIVVAAAGNSAQNNDVSEAYPANSTAANVITVAAVDAAGNLGTYSNYGATNVDVAAPGSNIMSTNPGKSYGYRTGTSMAAPFVSGVVALVWANNPSWSYTQVIAQVLNTATRSASLTGKVATGAIVNAAAAVGAATSSTVTPVTPPRVVMAVSVGPTAATISSARVTFDRAMAYSTLTAASCTLKLPGGQVVAATNVKTVDGSGGRSFDVIFGLQTQPGTYTLNIAAVARDLSGLTMEPYSTTFSRGTVTAPTTTTAPRVVLAVSAGPTAATISSARVTFDRAMAYSTLTAASCTLKLPGGQVVAATNVKTVDGSGGRSFDVIFGLQTQPGTYTLNIAAVARDLSGLTMEPYSTTFSRGTDTAPTTTTAPRVVLAVSAGPTAATISSARVTFDRAMAYSTLTAASCTLKLPGGQVVAATNVKTVDGSGGRSFDVIFGLQTQPGTYTLNIAAVARDLSGLTMEPYSTTFTR